LAHPLADRDGILERDAVILRDIEGGWYTELIRRERRAVERRECDGERGEVADRKDLPVRTCCDSGDRDIRARRQV
jgi:hypothetical protein